jgi:hypothetical protein
MAKNGVVSILSYLLLSLGLCLVSPSCVDPEDDVGGTGGTSLYVYDSNVGQVLVYSDVAVLFDEDTGTQPTPRRTILGVEQVKALAWGGMCFDQNNNQLYLVSETGQVVLINKAREWNNVVPDQAEMAFFRLGESDSDRLSSGKFGQASVDNGTLYVTESNSSDTQLWVVRNAAARNWSTGRFDLDGSNVGPNNGKAEMLKVPGDKGGTGVAARRGVVYAYFDDGNSFTALTNSIRYAGPRLRSGTASGFPIPPLDTSGMIIDEDSSNKVTMLARYGSLAIDMDDSVYLARHLNDAGASSNAIVIYKTPAFRPPINQPPETRDIFGEPRNIRVISHAVTKDWLAGAVSNGDSGSGTLWLWKYVSSSGSRAAKSISLGSGVSIRGLALDGQN